MNDASPIRSTPGQYFEDYPVGAVYTGGPITVSEQDILDFACRYDPQPMHVDKTSAEAGPFAGLIASGWHTGSLMMQLLARQPPLARSRRIALGASGAAGRYAPPARHGRDRAPLALEARHWRRHQPGRIAQPAGRCGFVTKTGQPDALPSGGGRRGMRWPTRSMQNWAAMT